jgi:hypothetical protein
MTHGPGELRRCGVASLATIEGSILKIMVSLASLIWRADTVAIEWKKPK